MFLINNSFKWEWFVDVTVIFEVFKNDFLQISDSVQRKLLFRNNELLFRVLGGCRLTNLLCRFKLKGLDKVWSEPVATPSKVYNYLYYGECTLEAKVLNNTGIVLSSVLSVSYSFEIKPPFYLSIFAKVIYLLLFLMLLAGIYFYI